MSELDSQFYKRADSHIHLSNSQISDKVSRGEVSASSMYATARFNAWISACGFKNAKEMAEERQEVIDYFTQEFANMLAENLDDYIDNFESYMPSPED